MNKDDLTTNTQSTLFALPDAKPLLGAGLTCNSCEHRQRWECNSKVFQYCGVRKSNRTDNGLLKIKCKDAACLLYEPCPNVSRLGGRFNDAKPVLPAGYISVETELPPLNKQVKCFMDNGTETVGYRYDNPNRSGWMTMYGGGLYANQIWSGIRVIGWQSLAGNVFGLGEEAELTAQKMKVAQMFNTPQQLHSSTTAAFLPNPCCMLPFSVHNGECLQWLKSLPDKCCDIFTDPPYNVGKDYGVWNDAMPDEEYAAWITDVLTECKRVANVLIVYVPKKWNLLYWNVLGAEFQEIILPFRPAGAIRYGYSNQFNKLLTNAKPKGKKPVLNVWDNMPQPGLGFFFREETYDHPGYTSEAITKRAIMQLCVSDVIADPFTGTGTTAVAALDAGKKFIGSEINAEYVAIAEKRVQRFINAPKLFLGLHTT